jgi:hypothetical protein
LLITMLAGLVAGQLLTAEVDLSHSMLRSKSL